MTLRIVIVGATGWVGRALVPAVAGAEDLELAAAVARKAAGRDVGEVAEALSAVERRPTARPVADLTGLRDTRGAQVGDGTPVPVHSVRMPSFILSCEALFGLPDERLVIRHDAGSSAAPYVAGTLLAVRRVGEAVGLRRGLDSLMG